MATVTLTPNPGIIEPHVTYSLEVAKKLTGLGTAAFREARRRGLAVKYVSGRGFVSGQALIEYIDKQGKDEK